MKDNTMKVFTDNVKRFITSAWTTRFLLIWVIVAMSISALHFNIGKHDAVWLASLWMSLGGLLLLLILLLIWNRPHTVSRVTPIAQDGVYVQTRWYFVIIGIGALALLAEINAKVFKFAELRVVSSHVQFALWVIASAHLPMAWRDGAIGGQRV